MSSAAARRDLFMPRPPGGSGRGLLLAVLVHGLLLAALAVGVNWRTSNPQGMQAELWAAVPQVAAPRAASAEPRPAPLEPVRPTPRPRTPDVDRPAPPPTPTPTPQRALPDPKIAIEQAKRDERARRLEEDRAQDRLKKDAARRLELAKAEQAEKAEKSADKKRREQEAQREKDKERVEVQRLADAREAAVKRMLNQAGGAGGEVGSTGAAAQSAAPSAGYQGRVIARIKPNIVFVDDLAGNPEAEVLVRLAPDGRIIGQKLMRSSGSREWDQAVQRAIERTEILPRDIDGRVPSSMAISFRPRE